MFRVDAAANMKKPRAGTRGFARRVPGTALDATQKRKHPAAEKGSWNFSRPARDFLGSDPAKPSVATLRLVRTRGCLAG
jgi:hypothetical protein